ncbi:MAG: hypothetical protein QGF21_13135 [Vicinamibacterales bacterium]|jgi:tetratricopeptide (TPR) repeat protein|nr:hypothetical protein [Vicinamibacterales bacterium]MDP7672877.1 hypothetical protein [Vicinamibacterales bacterium]HJO37316.1 hypothetical protein [Vicinamibacterales bacterium]|tara:strand:- start:3488 stop:4459 length:972 start_codon:yes stop_codon:yes gene_type:complete
MARTEAVAVVGVFVSLGLLLAACAPAGEVPEAGAMTEAAAEDAAEPRFSLIGTPLREPDFTPEVCARLEEDLAIAQAQMDVAPEREGSFIWLGRRLGYLARFSEAIDVFTAGLELHPDSYKLLRYRGRHRARNREFEGAIADYRRAADLVEGVRDTFEPDGILNSIEQPITTYRANIHYYLGQTSMAVGDYETTVRAMERSEAEPLGGSPDRLVSTAYWRYLAHRKLGQDDLADAVVAEVPEDLELIENFTYYESVLFFKGVRTREEVLDGADSLIRYAVAMDDHFRGEQEAAVRIWRELVSENAQGYWPAEAELVMAGETGS